MADVPHNCCLRFNENHTSFNEIILSYILCFNKLFLPVFSMNTMCFGILTGGLSPFFTIWRDQPNRKPSLVNHIAPHWYLSPMWVPPTAMQAPILPVTVSSENDRGCILFSLISMVSNFCSLILPHIRFPRFLSILRMAHSAEPKYSPFQFCVLHSNMRRYNKYSG